MATAMRCNAKLIKSKKELTSILQQVSDFEDAKEDLEQYMTPVEIAADFMWNISQTSSDLDRKEVLDLGCGTGMLTIAACVLGAARVTGIDCDPDAVEIAQDNVKILHQDYQERIDLIQANIYTASDDLVPAGKVDTVVTNPPFGTRVQGKRNIHNKKWRQKREGPKMDDIDSKQVPSADIAFLRKAASLLKKDGVIYYFHHLGSIKKVYREAEQLGLSVSVFGDCKVKFNLDKSHSFHRQDSIDRDVYILKLKFKIT